MFTKIRSAFARPRRALFGSRHDSAAGRQYPRRKALAVVTTILVGCLATAAFSLSYDALYHLALENGVSIKLAWAWPLVVDGFTIAASVSVLDATLAGRSTVWAWVLVLSASSVSIWCNIVHAHNTAQARLVAALPPIALALGFELLMGQLKARALEADRRAAQLITPAQVPAQREAEAPLPVVAALVPTAPVPVQRTVAAAPVRRRVAASRRPVTREDRNKAALKQLEKWDREGTQFTANDLADHFDMSRSWATTRINDWRKVRTTTA